MGTTTVQASLDGRLRAIHNFIYANDGIKQHARVTDELVKLLYLKLEDERRGESDFALRSGATETAKGIRAAFEAAARGNSSLKIFEPDERIRLSSESIEFAVRQLQGAAIREQDPKGVAFQAVLGHSLRAELGQFFTPDPVKRLLIELTDPHDQETVCDPASGSAGLLLDARAARPAAHLRLEAVEVDASLARIARLNLFLSGADAPAVFRTDALQPLEALSAATEGAVEAESVDVVITNPPFGSKGKVTDTQILRQLPNVVGGRKAVPPEILFIERVVQVLRPGGRAGIVLPIGVLSNPSQRHVRDYLHATCQVYASIALPPETFMPTGNGVNAAMIFIRKGPKAHEPYPVFRAVSRSVGYDHRGRAQRGLVDDVPLIIQAWRDFFERHGREYLWR